MYEYARKQLENGNDLVAVRGSTGGKWSKTMITLVEIAHDEPVKTTDRRRVIKIHNYATARSNAMGPRSSFYRIFVDLVGQVDPSAKDRIDAALAAQDECAEWAKKNPSRLAACGREAEIEMTFSEWVKRHNELACRGYL